MNATNTSTITESFALSWTHLHAYRGDNVGSNCIAVGDTTDEFLIVDGTITIDWRPGDVSTSDGANLFVSAGQDLTEHHVEENITGPGEHVFDVSGWDISFDGFDVSLLVGIRAPETPYLGHENQATITFDWEYVGEYETFLEGGCTRGITPG